MTPTRRSSVYRPPLTSFLIYPATLLIGSLFSLISPTARPTTTATAAAAQNKPQPAVNYFASKHNIFNQYFVKIGWAWMTIAFFLLIISQPAYISVKGVDGAAAQQRLARKIGQAIVRYSVATLSWYLVTQWFFGPPIIDRTFTLTGGRCENGSAESFGMQLMEELDLVTAATCKAAGGDWKGGYDVSGHVFMLVLMTVALGCEFLGVSSWSCGGGGAFVKGKVEGEAEEHQQESLEGNKLSVWSARFVLGIIALSWWMLLMTAIFFHTWVEKVWLPTPSFKSLFLSLLVP